MSLKYKDSSITRPNKKLVAVYQNEFTNSDVTSTEINNTVIYYIEFLHRAKLQNPGRFSTAQVSSVMDKQE